MKRIISILLLIATLLSAFSISAHAADSDDNAMGGDGDLNNATKNYAWYNSKQYFWKVTLFVGKSDQASKQDNLQRDFHRIGTVIMKKSGWTVPSSTKFASGTKVDYYGGAAMAVDTSPYIISDTNCPAVPYASGGDIETVKAYFGSTGTMSTVLNGIADDLGTTKQSMLSKLTFTIGGQTKSGWDYDYVNPNATTNRVPWVIVYEPMILLNLKDNTTKLAFTATEFSLCEINGWYDWNLSGGSGQNCASLPERYLPTSVQLEESWFGYPVYGITDSNYRWEHEDVVKGGGWGMRWMAVAVQEPQKPDVDYGCSFSSVNTSPSIGGYGNVTINWTNYEERAGTVTCCLYRGNTLLWSGQKTIPGGTTIRSSFSVQYPSSGRQTLKCTINWENRAEETDSSDNSATTYVTPVQPAEPPALDYGAYFLAVEQPDQDTYGRVDVLWKNWAERSGFAYCELYVNGTRVWSEIKTFKANESFQDSFDVYYTGIQPHTLEVRINYANRDKEADATDNLATEVVIPTKTIDDTYDFSVSDLTVTPKTVHQGKTCTVSFVSDNWNQDLSYEDVLVEILVDSSIRVSLQLDYVPYGRFQHTYTIYLETLGSHTISARINWSGRSLEDNRDNNKVSETITVKPYYEFSVSELQAETTTCYLGDPVRITFTTDSWDQFNDYEDIRVELLVDGNVVMTKFLDYSAYATRYHTWTVYFNNNPGVHKISARINWSNRTSETNANNNITDEIEVTAKEQKDLTIEAVEPNSEYTAGVTVVTSFIVHNKSAFDVTPDQENMVFFKAYYYYGDKEVAITKQAWNQAVIPAHDQNLVYFKWTVPEDLAGQRVYCEATVNYKNTVVETDTTNNTDCLVKTVASKLSSQTADTQFETAKPNGFVVPTAPEVREGRASWSVWAYEDGAFVKRNFCIALPAFNPMLVPDVDTPSSEFEDSQWLMRSGYGFTLSFTTPVVSVDGYAKADRGAYTEAQQAYAVFPEFKYSTATGYYRTLQKVNGLWALVPNENTDNNDRLHFTPLWYPNGKYIVSATARDVWTPAGMISSTKNSAQFAIVGAAYDDWYVGEQ